MTCKEMIYLLNRTWSRNTAYEGDMRRWRQDNPAIGQCAVTALLFNRMFGGEIIRGSTDDGMSHYWNSYKGKEIDLTITQFKTKPVFTTKETRSREDLLANESTRKRYEMLEKRFKEMYKIHHSEGYEKLWGIH